MLMALVWFFANGGLVVWDFVADTPPPATFGLNDTTLMPRGMQRVIRSSSSAASILGFLGLSIGYMRKWRHLPRHVCRVYTHPVADWREGGSVCSLF